MSQKSVITVEKMTIKIQALSQGYGIPSKEADIDSMVPKQTNSKEFTLIIAFYLGSNFGPEILIPIWNSNTFLDQKLARMAPKMDLHFVFAGTVVFVDN